MRIVWHCEDRVGIEMAGPGIRVLELCRRLAATHQITIVAPGASTLSGEPFSTEEPDGLAAALREADAFVAQGFKFPLRAAMGFRGRFVLDLYDPVLLEQLMQFGPQPSADQRLSLGHVRARLLALLRRADHVLCASARQRAFWLGWLGAAGRLGPGALSDDPAGRRLVVVVPFGIPEQPPRPAADSVRRELGVPEGSALALFWGGLWDWMDPALAVKAVAALRDRGRCVDLVFIAGSRPGGVTMTLGAASARTAAAALSVEDRVHFLDRWIPYADRGGILLEADVAVTAHHASLEAELAFRTRVLDCLWAGLPIAATRGDALGEDAEREGWGRCADVGDAAGLASAIAALVEPGAREAARAAMGPALERFRWARSAEAIDAVLAQPAPTRAGMLLPGEVAGERTLAVAAALGRRLWRRVRR